MFWRKINVIVQVPFVMPIASHGLCVLQHFCVMTQQMETDIHLHHDYRCSLFIKEKKCKGTFRIFKLGLFCFISLFAITVTIYRLSYDNILQAICGSNLAQNINCHLSEKISLFVWDNFFFFPFSLARPPVGSVLNFKDMFSHTVLLNNCGLDTWSFCCILFFQCDPLKVTR